MSNCAIPWTVAHEAPLSTGFSRQEYWSGLPFPSPMHTCMLNRFSHVQLCDPMDSSPRGSSVHGILQARILEWVAISFSQLLPVVKNLPASERDVGSISWLGRSPGVGSGNSLWHFAWRIP